MVLFTGPHTEASMLNRQEQTTGILNMRHLGYLLRQLGMRPKNSAEELRLKCGGPRDSPRLLCPWALLKPCLFWHTLPVPSLGRLLHILQNLPIREPALLSRLFKGYLLAPAGCGVSLYQSIDCLCVFLPTPFDCEQ